MYNFIKWVGIIFSRVFFRIKVYNREFEPKEGGVILCSNHISMLDPILVAMHMKRKIKFMSKEEIFTWPVLGYIAKHVGAFPVSRGPGDLSAMKIALKTLKEGNVLGIFPEGGRKHSEEESTAKAGVAALAFKTKTTVLPVHIITKASKLKIFCKISVVYGKPIPFEEMGFTTGSSDEQKEISQKILNDIFALKV